MNDTPTTPSDLAAELERLRRENARLKQDRHFLQTILDFLPDHVYFKDRDSRLTLVNRAMALDLGFTSPEDVVGKSDADFYTPEHAEPALADERRIMETGRPLVGVIEHETFADGHDSWVTTTKMPFRDPSGAVVGTFGVSRDVSDWKRAELALRESEAVYRSLVDNLTHSVFRKDLNGRVTFVNHRYCESMGRRPEEMLGKTDFDLFPRELAEKYVADDQKVLESRQSLEVVEAHRRPNGELLYVQVVKTPVIDAEGRLMGVQGMFWDVTERKRYQETLERLAAIVESTEDAVIGADVDGLIENWNPGAERLYGYTAAEAVGRQVSMLVPRELRYEIDSIKEQIAAGERISNLETVRVSKDGRKIDVSISASPIRNAEGRVVGISGIARNMTEKRQAEHALFQLAALVESSHDAIVGCTLEGDVTTWNKAAERFYGYSSAEMKERLINVLLPAARKDEWFELVGRAAREEKIEGFRTLHQHRDGRAMDVALTVSPIIDPSVDRVTGISIIARHALGAPTE